MSDVWGNHLKLAIFGESHGSAIGVVIDGIPSGEAIDMDLISMEMLRRSPGNSPFSSSRKESDKVEIVSGIYGGYTTGSSICGIIRNNDKISSDYDTILRPGHADWTALIKYSGHADMRGGGHFSGRLTAPLVFAGSIAKQILGRSGTNIFARIHSIAGISDENPQYAISEYKKISSSIFPVIDENKSAAMQNKILEAKSVGDSVGGIVELAAFGVSPGIGEPFFASLESTVASLLFSIPAVKGVEFGSGFELSKMRGSAANDAIYIDENKQLYSKSNHSGGILGGISNGMPIVVRIAVKPTPSIALPSHSVDSISLEERSVQTHGRHDPCIVPRAVPVAEAALALAILDSSYIGGIK